jgi:hypothetical protein
MVHRRCHRESTVLRTSLGVNSEEQMKQVLRIVIIILVMGFVLFNWNWVSSKKAIADFSHKVQPGTQVSEARSYAGQMGLKYISASHRDESGHYRDLVTSTGVMGRAVCEIQHDGTVVMKVISTVHD